MKRIYLIFSFVLALSSSSFGQLVNGSVAPDFTVTDINGTTHNLYTYLNAGKTVYIDIFATWCNPCWNYHQSHALEDLWTMYGPSGTNDVVVIAIEGSPSTNTACITGPSGCNSSTWGNWTTGITYPIVHTDALNGTWNGGTYPTIYMVCPADKKVWIAGQNTAAGHWGFRTNKCINGAIPLGVTLVNKVDVKCINTATAKIDILGNGGFAPYTYSWSNGSTFQDLINIPAGTYTVTVTASNGATVVAGPYTVSNPSSALTTQGVVVQQSGCNGVLGSVQINPSGGWNSSYFYAWNNGATTQSLTNVPAGLYQCTVTDNNYCTKSVSVSLQQAPPPTAVIASPSTITCANPTAMLNASGSSSGANPLSFSWSALAGNIVSGGNTSTATVNQSGAYQVVVTDNISTCTADALVQVSANQTAPTVTATPQASVSCSQSTTTLTGFALNGTQYQWTASNGGVIVSGATTLNCVVSAAGTYTFTATNTTNGCTASANSVVTNAGNLPNVTATGATITCGSPTATLMATSTTASVTYAWTGPNGFVSNQQNPAVTAPGAYTVIVTAPNGCTNSAPATVVSNAALPTVSIQASSSQLTCVTTQSTLTSSVTPSANYTYQWTLNGANIGTNAMLTATTGGVYTLLATNAANGCSSTAQITITQSTAVVTTAQVTNQVSCFGGSNGTATASATGGSGTYNFAWGNTSGSSIGNLAAGVYTVTCTDNQGCTSTSTVTITQPTLLVANATATAQTATGVNDGTASATASGGTSPYTYAWSTGATTAQITGLAPGTYTIIITDNKGCVKQATVSVLSVNCAIAGTVMTNHITCPGGSNGSATATITGAAGAVTYAWNTPTSPNSNTVNGLPSGTYAVTATDAQSCQIVLQFSINMPNAVTLSTPPVVTNTQCPNSTTGVISLTSLSGGTAPLTVSWNNGATGTSIGNLSAGVYTPIVTDGNGCTTVLSSVTVLSIDLTAPTIVCPEGIRACVNAAGIQWSLPVATDNCAINPSGLVQTAGPAVGSAFPVGQTTIAYAYTDSGANAASCSFVVTVTSPIVLASSNIVNPVTSVSSGSVTVTIGGGTAPYTYQWTDQANVVVSTAQNLTNITSSGSFTLKVTDNDGCVMTFPVFTVTATVSANEPIWMQSLEVLPNPVVSVLQVNWSHNQEMEMSIMDMNGRVINTLSSQNAHSISIPVIDLSEGIYLLRFACGTETGYRKFVKQ
jgi:hypothetical protein